MLNNKSADGVSTCYDDGVASSGYDASHPYAEDYDSDALAYRTGSQSKRPATAVAGMRVKAAAADLIFKMWGYDPTNVLGQDTQITYNNFMKEKNFKR